MRRRVLIFHAGALGDFVLTWPMALAVSRLMPQHRVAYVTASDKGELARRVLRVEALDVEAGWHTLHGAEIDPRCQKLLDATQTVFGLGQDKAWAQRVQAAGVPQVHTVVPPVRWNCGGRAIECTAEQLDSALASGVRSAIRLVETRGLLASRTPSQEIVLHVGSGSTKKNWPHFDALAELLRKSGRKVRVIGGEVEAAQHRHVEVLPTLPELLNVLETAATFVGNDSGPGHLAAMLGVPTVSLAGPHSDPARWAPTGPSVQVIRESDLAAITPQQVMEALPQS